MKKTFTILIAILLIFSITVPAASARNRRPGHHPALRHHARHYPVIRHHVTKYRITHHHGDWEAFGIGLLAGAVVTNLFYQPPQREVIVRHSPRVIHYSTPVIIEKSPTIINMPESQIGEAVVTAELLNVRSGPGKNYPVIHQACRNSKLIINGFSEGWLYVKLPGGGYGWVMQKFTVSIQPPASG